MQAFLGKERRRNKDGNNCFGKNVSKIFPVGKTCLENQINLSMQVNDVSFDIQEGETFSVVGESGCGKSTTGRLIDHLLIPDSGEIWFEGKDISKLSENEMRPLRKDIQMIFQDPAGSLNPRMRVEDLVRRAAAHPHQSFQRRAL